MWQTIKESGREWSEDKVPRLSAALAFYTMLSLAPLLIILAKLVSWFVGGETNAQDKIRYYITSASSPQTAEAVLEIFRKDAEQPERGFMASIVSLIILFVSASGVFGELQTSMNQVFDVQPRPNRGIIGTIKDRFFSMTLVLGVAFLLLVSLVVSTVLSGISGSLMPSANFFWNAINFVVSLVIITGLFALIFKYLPDVTLPWKPVLVGAAVTAVLFTIGKFALGWYLGKGSTVSAYGALGSLVALLLWVYYSSMIVFFGAELVQVYARQHGFEIIPKANAMPIGDEGKTAADAKGELKEEPWYPAVPVRRELAVAPSYAAASANGGGGGAGSKLLMLAAGVAVGKFLLGGGSKGGKKLAIGRIVEPGYVTRKHLYENKEYVLRVRPPLFLRRAADTVRRGYEKAKNRISEFVEG